ncbi:MAG: TolC family protein [Bacteroidales bacterium]
MKQTALIPLISLAALLLSLQLSGQSSDSLLDLHTCKRMALENNHKLRKADLQINIADQNTKSAFTRLLPSLDVTAQYLRTNKPFYLLDENQFFPVVPFWSIDQEDMSLLPDVAETPLIYGAMIDTDTGEVMVDEEGNPVFLQYGYIPRDEMTFGSKDNYIINGGITMPVYMGGKLRRQYKMSRIVEDMQHDRADLSEDEVLFEVEKLYWKIVSLQEKKKLADAYRAMLDTLVMELENIYQEGIITRNDLLKAQKKQNEVMYQQFQAENGIRLAGMALNQAIGLPLDSIPRLEGSLDAVRIFPDGNRLVDKAIQTRPELAVLDKSIQLADQTVKLAWSRFLPNIIATGNYSFYKPNPYNGFTRDFGGDYNVGLTCRIPITQWGNRIHSVKSAKYLRELAEVNRQEKQEKISLQVQQSWNAYLEAFRKVDVKEIGVKQAGENLRIMQDKFDEGMITTSDLLEAQALWQEARSELIEAKTQLRTQEIKLKKHSGNL